MKRRSFIKAAAAGAALAPIMLNGVPARAKTSLAALAQMPVESDKILIIIQLFGGNDGMNMLLPLHDEDAYKQLRPKLAVPKDKAWNFQDAVYLHPALATGSRGGLGQMLKSGSLAIVQGVGYDNPNLSHFRSTDIWLSGINNSDPNVQLQTGWVGRFLEQRYPNFPAQLPDHPLAIQLGGFSLALMSEKGRMGIEVTDPSAQKSLTPELDTLDPASAGTRYQTEYDFVADIASRSNKYAAAVRDAYSNGKTKLKASYASDDFAKQMASVGALIAGGLTTKVYVVSMGGFDTHFNQQTDLEYGNHPQLMARLSDAVAQFTYDMTSLGLADRVVGMTVSEFGRRPEENGSFGTDHGAASVQFVFGTQVNSGVYGLPMDLRNLDAQGDLTHTVDYRSVYSDVLTTWFGMTTTDALSVLQDTSITPISILKAQHSGVKSPQSNLAVMTVACSPNPFTGSAILQIQLPRAGNVRIDITSMDGRTVAIPLERWMDAGEFGVPLNANMSAGSYLCTIRSGAQSGVTMIRCVR